MNKKCLAQDLLKELFNYDPETGVFTRKTNNNRWKIGDIAGHKHLFGYVKMRINKIDYMAHRLAWVYMYGSIPESLTVDHINGVRDDNRIDNLRLANGHKEQAQNLKKRNDNTSGYVGVYPHILPNKWIAQIRVNGKAIYLGIYDTPEEASEAYIKAKVEHHTFNPIQRGH